MKPSLLELAERLDEAIALAEDWQPNKAWPEHALTVMLTMREAKSLRAALRASNNTKEQEQ
jgi:hypothetical protein